MSNDLISILIPCYNTEKYLYKILNCVTNQTYQNLEILILNDGSTDCSLKIMEEYQSKDSRIKIISRENKGVSASRNELIQKSTGKYVMFVDSDDLIAPNMVELLYYALRTHECDLAMCNILKWYIDETIDTTVVPTPTNRYQICTPDDLLLNMIIVGDHYDFPTAKLIKKELLDKIEFPLGRVYEDTATLYKIYCRSSKAIVLEDKLYYYLEMRPDSITTRKYVVKNLNDNYLAIRERYEHLLNSNPKIINEVRLGYIRNCLALLQRVYSTGEDELINNPITQKIIKEIPEVYSQISNKDKRNIIINNYRLSLLFLILNGNIEEFSKVINFVNNKEL